MYWLHQFTTVKERLFGSTVAYEQKPVLCVITADGMAVLIAF